MFCSCSRDPLQPTKTDHPPPSRTTNRRNTKTGKCATCEQQTQGIFNRATDILKKMKKQKEREKEAGGG